MKAGGCVQVGPNPQPRADFPGGGVRFGHDSAAEGLQDARGPPGPLCTVRAAEVLRKCSGFCGFAAGVQRGPSWAPPGAARAGRMPAYPAGRRSRCWPLWCFKSVSADGFNRRRRCRPLWGAPWTIRGPLLGPPEPGGCQGTGRAAEVLRASWAHRGPAGAVRAGRCPGKHSKWLSICKISGALARMLFPIFGFCSQVKIYPFCYINPWGDTWREKKTAGTLANTGFIFLFSLEKSDIALLSLFSNEILLIYGIF